MLGLLLYILYIVICDTILSPSCTEGCVQVQCCFSSTETIRTIRDGEPRTAPSTFTDTAPELWSLTVQVQCGFTSTETVRTIRGGEPRTATSTFTQLLSSDLLQFKLSVALSPQRPQGLLGKGRGAQDGQLDFHTAPEL